MMPNPILPALKRFLISFSRLTDIGPQLIPYICARPFFCAITSNAVEANRIACPTGVVQSLLSRLQYSQKSIRLKRVLGFRFDGMWPKTGIWYRAIQSSVYRSLLFVMYKKKHSKHIDDHCEYYTPQSGSGESLYCGRSFFIFSFQKVEDLKNVEITENVKYEKCTLQDLEYGEKTENHGK